LTPTNLALSFSNRTLTPFSDEVSCHFELTPKSRARQIPGRLGDECRDRRAVTASGDETACTYPAKF
jgi:hypothetical protein